MIHRRIKYHHPRCVDRGNKCHDGYFLAFSTEGSIQSNYHSPVAIVETLEGDVVVVDATDIMFVEAPYNCIVQYISDNYNMPKISGEFQQWGFNKQQQSIAIVKLTEDMPRINYKKGEVIECFPNEIHFLS